LGSGLTNFAGSTLTGGTYLLTGTLQFNNANLVTNAAVVVLNGPAAQIVNHSNADALTNFASNTAAGSFTIQGGRNLTTAAALVNAGSLTIGTGSTLAAALVDIQAGSLTGAGTIAGGLSNAGTVSPAGILSVTGSYTQTPAGALNIDIGGHTP